LVGKSKGKDQLGWWEDNIKIDLKEIGWEGRPWIDLAQDRHKWWAVLNIIINSGFFKLWVVA
jgi:hypothetical protein